MENAEKQALIKQAMRKVKEAREMVAEAVEDSSVAGNYFAYGEYGFAQLLGEGNRFDSSIESLLEEFPDDSK